VAITEGAFSDIEALFVANDGVGRVVLQKLIFPLSSVRKSAFAPTG
jgi:hypothetical protein